MDLAFTNEELAFREEVRAFFRDNVPPDTRRKLQEGRHLSKDEMVTWWRILNKKGWGVSHWPKEYGGTGWSSVQHYIFNEELQMHPAPAPLAFGVSMVGPRDLHVRQRAAEEALSAAHRQCRRLVVPGLFRARRGIGSRLAEDQGRAQGRQVVVNGQKTWTTLAQYADMIFCLVPHRSERQEAGRHLLHPGRHEDPGITVRPIDHDRRRHEVNEVFFDDVKVPVENLVGEENKGWDYAKFLLGNERTGIARVGVSKERIRRIKELAAEVESGGRPLIEDPDFREKLVAVRGRAEGAGDHPAPRRRRCTASTARASPIRRRRC